MNKSSSKQCVEKTVTDSEDKVQKCFNCQMTANTSRLGTTFFQLKNDSKIHAMLSRSAYRRTLNQPQVTNSTGLHFDNRLLKQLKLSSQPKLGLSSTRTPKGIFSPPRRVTEASREYEGCIVLVSTVTETSIASPTSTGTPSLDESCHRITWDAKQGETRKRF